MINMERLFEFYARTVIKRALEGSQYYLDSYSKHIFLQSGVTRAAEAERNIHLMPFCIPDILICKKEDLCPVFVMDAKYKSHVRSARSDTHQLLAYVLLTKVKRCGFVFPGETTTVKTMSSGTDRLTLATDDLRYYELLLGNDDLPTHTITLDDEHLHKDAEHSVILKPSNFCIPPDYPVGKEDFLDGLRELHIGEWRSNYDPRRFGYVVLDGTQWELEIFFSNGHKTVKIYGSNPYPYNFNKFLELLGIDPLDDDKEDEGVDDE